MLIYIYFISLFLSVFGVPAKSEKEENLEKIKDFEKKFWLQNKALDIYYGKTEAVDMLSEGFKNILNNWVIR